MVQHLIVWPDRVSPTVERGYNGVPLAVQVGWDGREAALGPTSPRPARSSPQRAPLGAFWADMTAADAQLRSLWPWKRGSVGHAVVAWQVPWEVPRADTLALRHVHVC